jgi:hypothetical protein
MKKEDEFIHKFLPSDRKETAGTPRKIVQIVILLYGSGENEAMYTLHQIWLIVDI